VGDTTIESTSGVNSGFVYANRYTFSAGVVNALALYTNGTGQLEMALYGDNGLGTAPGTLLAQTGPVSTTLSPGWTTAVVPAQSVTAGNYWLAMQTASPVSIFYTYNGSALPYIAQAFGPFPTTYAGFTACACSVITMKALFCP
jgi:hypothetical protein